LEVLQSDRKNNNTTTNDLYEAFYMNSVESLVVALLRLVKLMVNDATYVWID